MAISDIELQSNYYKVFDENGRKIADKHTSVVGDLKGFNSEYMVFMRGDYYAIYDEKFYKIVEKHKSTIGDFRNITNTINFERSGYVISFDENLKEISRRHLQK